MSSRITTSARSAKGIRTKTLEAAADLLSTEGLDGLNLKAIAEAAGIGVGSIYYYFRNKEELLLSLAIAGWGDLARLLTAEQNTPPDPATPLGGMARAYFAFAQTRPPLFSLMYDERMMARHESLREAERRTFLAFQAAVESDPRFPAELQESIALALWALGRGIAATTSSQPDGKLTPELSNKVWDGVRYLVGRSPFI